MGKEQSKRPTPEELITEIQAEAGRIFENRAKTGAPGDSLSDWLQAEKKVKAKYSLN